MTSPNQVKPLRAVILNSRQHLQPTRHDAWVKSSAEAVRWLKSEKHALVCSVGMQSCELVTALALKERLEVELWLPTQSESDFTRQVEHYSRQFPLNQTRFTMFPVYPAESQNEEDNLYLQRDRRLCGVADLLIPVSIRPKGHLERLLDEMKESGKGITDKFRAAYLQKGTAVGYVVEQSRLNPELELLKNRFIFHWTCGPNGPWPSESLFEYYSAVVESSSYARTAYATLKNIMSKGAIKASSRHMPGHIPTVSFSGLLPKEVAPLMRWRARYGRMSFEPYALGVDRSMSGELAILPVKYYKDRTEFNKVIEEAPVWLTQSTGAITDWSEEREFRHLGDFSFDTIPAHKLLLVCRFPSEVAAIAQQTGIRTISYTV